MLQAVGLATAPKLKGFEQSSTEHAQLYRKYLPFI